MPSRVFVAIELPQPVRESLGAAVDALMHADPAWTGEKRVACGLLHVTLAFVGAVADPAMPDLLAAVTAAAGRARPFELRACDVRAVPSPRRAAMVWATLAGDTGAACDLAADVAKAAGLACDRPLRPHVTLVRARRPRLVNAEAIEAASALLSGPGKELDGIVSVRSVTVFSSTLGPAGPSYEALARVALGTAGNAASAD